MCEVIPGILEKNWTEIEKKLRIAKNFSKIVHIDIIDGKFAPNATFLDPMPFSKYARELFFEVHMMVENPIQYLESFAKAGFKRFIGQIEMMPDQAEFVIKANVFGEVGLAIDGPTSSSAIKVSFSDLDTVLVMMVKAGQSGQEFKQEYLKKIRMLKSTLHDKSKAPIIEVDGGINDETIVLAKNAGARRFVSTSFIFNNRKPSSQFNLLKTLIT